MIRLRDLSVNLGNQRVLSDINLEIVPGKWHCFVGPNGAGKSTLLKVLLGRVAYSGEAKENNLEIFRNLKREIAYVPQNPQIPAGMNLFEYVSLGRSRKDGWGKVNKAKVLSVLEQTGLFGLQDKHLTAISGGELQRAMLARVLLQDASLILLDEPTSALDMHHQISELGKIEELKLRGKTIISTMHDLTLAAMYADEISVLQSGKILSTGPVDQVIHAAELKRAFNNGISVQTLDSGSTVIYPSKK